MELIGQYPFSEGALQSYYGKPVGAVLANGDIEFGMLERLHDGHMVLRPLQASEAAVASLKQKFRSHPAVKDALRKIDKAKVRALGYGGAYPYGWGYGNWGWGAGWWWIWPLFFIAALFAFPFFWW